MKTRAWMKKRTNPCITAIVSALLLLFPVAGLCQTPWVMKDPQAGTCDVFDTGGDFFVPSGGTICWAVSFFYPGGGTIEVDFNDGFQDSCAQIDCASVTVDCPSDPVNCTPTNIQITKIEMQSIGTCVVSFHTPVDISCEDSHPIENQAEIVFPFDTLLSNPPSGPTGPTLVTTVAGDNYLLKACCDALSCDITSFFPLPRYAAIPSAPDQTTDTDLTDTTHPVCFYGIESPAAANSLHMAKSAAVEDEIILSY